MTERTYENIGKKENKDENTRKKETIVDQTEFTRPKCQHETGMKFERINELLEKCMRFGTEDLRLKDVTNQ